MPKTKPKPHRTTRPNSRDLARYRKFAQSYLAVGQPTYFNAERSAANAGYAPGYCKGKAYTLLGRVGVQEEMAKIREQRRKQTTIASPEEVLETLTQQLRTLPNELAGEDGALIPLNKLTREQAQAVAGVKETRKAIASGEDVITETKLEYKLVDCQKAAEMLAKHHGLFEKDNEQQKASEGSVKLVMMPTGDMTLDEWTRQVEALNKKDRAGQAAEGAD